MRMEKVFASRGSHLWYFLSWVILLSFTVIVHHAILASSMIQLTPETLQIIHVSYETIKGILIIAIVANITSLIFREIKYSFALDHMVVRKFLPTIRFIVLLIIWII